MTAASYLDGLTAHLDRPRHLQHRFDFRVAGSAHVSVATMRRMLGDNAWNVWMHLAAHPRRTRNGVVTTTVTTIRRRCVQSAEQVKLALAKLADAGIVTAQKRVRAGERDGQVIWRTPRKVLGIMLAGGDALFPNAVASALNKGAKVETRGGKRAGAGRPKGTKNKPKSACPTCGHVGCFGECLACSACCRRTMRETRSLQVEGAQVIDFQAALDARSGIKNPPYRNQKPPIQESKTPHPINYKLVTIEDSPSESAPLGGAVVSPSGGADDGALHPVAYGIPHPAVPEGITYPAIGRVRPAKVPDPPMLAKVAPDDPAERARMLARWFEVTVEAVLGVKVWTFRSEKVSDITQSKHFDKLVECADTLDNLGVSPVAWFGFVCELWSKRATKKSAPALSLALSSRMMVEQKGWFEREAPQYGGRMVYAPAHRSFMERSSQLSARLAAAPAHVTDDRIARVVEEYFPGGAQGYKRARDDAEQASRALQLDLDARVRRGEWVW